MLTLSREQVRSDTASGHTGSFLRRNASSSCRSLDYPIVNAYVRVTNDIAGEEQAAAPVIWTHTNQYLLGHNLVDFARESVILAVKI